MCPELLPSLYRTGREKDVQLNGINEGRVAIPRGRPTDITREEWVPAVSVFAQGLPLWSDLGSTHKRQTTEQNFQLCSLLPSLFRDAGPHYDYLSDGFDFR